MASFNTADAGIAPYPVASPANPQRAANARTLDVPAAIAEANARRPSFGQRLKGALAYVILGADAPATFFGPMQPISPQAQPPERGAQGRAFDYPVGYNTRITPRNDEPISFATLRNLADGYDLMRLVLETRKDQVAQAKWSFGPKDETKRKDADVKNRCAVLTAFWESPDREHTWSDWLRMLLEQLFVYDAPALHPIMTRGGDLYALQVLDGATITRKLAIDGRTPSFIEGPAYQQILKGLPAVDYVTLVPREIAGPTDPESGLPMPELLYKPRNLRVDRVYGYGPVEQVITTVNIALRRQFFQLSYYTDGAQPDLLMQVPETWNPNQIEQFQQWWDSMLAGNLQNRRKGLFIPHGVEPYNTKDQALKDEYDDWLARIICFAFSISPTPFIKQMNRATAETQQEQAKVEGLQPILSWIADLANIITAKKFGWPDITLRWDEEEALTASEQQTVYSGYVKSKIYHPDEIRQKLGEDPMPDELRLQMDMANFNDAVNSTVLPEEQQQAQNEHAIALAAARPAPIAPGATKAEVQELAALLKSAPQPAPIFNVDARTSINEGAMKVDVAPAAVNVAPATVNVAPAAVTVHTPEIHQGDTFVDVGATNVKVDGPQKSGGITRDAQGVLRTADGRIVERTTTYGRDENGNLIGKITDSTTRVVRAERNADGKLLAKVEA